MRFGPHFWVVSGTAVFSCVALLFHTSNNILWYEKDLQKHETDVSGFLFFKIAQTCTLLGRGQTEKSLQGSLVLGSPHFLLLQSFVGRHSLRAHKL